MGETSSGHAGLPAREWLESRLLERFLRYVRVDTTSNRHSETEPTTPGQMELARLLAAELQGLGLQEVDLDPKGFLFAWLPANLPRGAAQPPEIGFIAHLDTSDAAPGRDIAPQVHRRYDGEAIRLEGGLVLDPAEYPELARYRGQTVITSDGRTLLGADDKAGLAEIVTAMEYLLAHREIPHGRVRLCFTPDEEQGLSMQRIPVAKIGARYCYTFDGDAEGTIETECFEGHKATVRFRGKAMHTGDARGKLINAVEMASRFVCLLPGVESPQATDGRYGFYFPQEISGTLEQATVSVLLRDFELREVERRIEALHRIAAAIEAAFPGGRVEVSAAKEYANMRRFLEGAPEVVGLLEQAIRETGLEPLHKIIRGGTDGARLSELGVPTPNVFTGGHNYHSRLEWAALPAMVRAAQTAVNLCRLWASDPQPR